MFSNYSGSIHKTIAPNLPMAGTYGDMNIVKYHFPLTTNNNSYYSPFAIRGIPSPFS